MTNQFSNPGALVDAIFRASKSLVPPQEMLPSSWAEANVKIPIGNAIPGPINFDNAPYQRGMLDAAVEPGIQRITLKTGAQLGKTTVQQCLTGYFISHDPRSQIFAQPTQGDMQTFLETKLRPMLQANPEISGKMAKQRGREGVNNGRIISYVGGWLMFSWAGSPKTMRQRSAPVVQADEIDGYDATPEGDPVELLVQRSVTFGDLALCTESSTPTIKGASRIETAFEEGDKRRFFVACPDCGAGQVLKWENVTWEGRRSTGIKDAELDIDGEHKPGTVGYICEGCGSIWDDGKRISAIRDAEKKGYGWVAEKPFLGHASFHAPEILSTFLRLRKLVQSYLSKVAKGDLQTFVNVSLGEAYEETGERADPSGLLARCITYPAPVPMAGLYLTAGIDMQTDRLEVEIVAWGEAERSWSIDYRVLWGDPLAGDVWDDLDDLLAEKFLHESGHLLPISSACLDTGGTSGYTQRAYEYSKGKTGRRLFAVKGVPGWGRAIVEKPQRKQSGKNKRKVDLFLVGVDEAKLVVMRRLANEVKGSPGYCEFPEGRDAEYFQQLTAEKMTLRYVKGQPIREWSKPDKARNEALDCRVYALAALKIMQPSFKRLAEKLGSPTVPAQHHIVVPKKPLDHSVADAIEAIMARKRKVEIPQDAQIPASGEDGGAKKKRSTIRRSRGRW